MRDSIEVTTTIGELVAADAARSEVIVQPQGGDIVLFPYGETGDATQGLVVTDGTTLFFRGPAAKHQMNAITASGTVTTNVFGI
jgi:hypothetical protein